VSARLVPSYDERLMIKTAALEHSAGSICSRDSSRPNDPSLICSCPHPSAVRVETINESAL